MRINPVMFVSLFFIFTVSAYAGMPATDSRVRMGVATMPENPCPMTENSSININFNSQRTGLSQVKNMMNDKIKEVEALAKEAGVDKFELQSMNYSIYTNTPGGYDCANDENSCNVYQLNGSMSFTILPSEKGADLMILLQKKGYTAGLNVNMYRSCH
jgi:uncharacterized protein YggE